MNRRPLAAFLVALALLYVLWFGRDRHAEAAMMVFALPPLPLAIAAWRGWSRAGFFSGVAALLWFSHGVMVAWTDAGQRGFALGTIAIALGIVYVSSIDGIRARVSKR